MRTNPAILRYDRLHTLMQGVKIRAVHTAEHDIGKYNLHLMVYPDCSTVHVRLRRELLRANDDTPISIMSHVFWRKVGVAQGYELFEDMKTAAALDVIPSEATR